MMELIRWGNLADQENLILAMSFMFLKLIRGIDLELDLDLDVKTIRTTEFIL